MRAEQPIKLCKPRRKMRVTVGVIITDRPKAVLSLRFHLFMFGAVQFLSVLILTLLYVQLFNSVTVTELPPVLENAANSAYHLFCRCLLRYVCPCFPLMFMASFGF